MHFIWNVEYVRPCVILMGIFLWRSWPTGPVLYRFFLEKFVLSRDKGVMYLECRNCPALCYLSGMFFVEISVQVNVEKWPTGPVFYRFFLEKLVLSRDKGVMYLECRNCPALCYLSGMFFVGFVFWVFVCVLGVWGGARQNFLLAKKMPAICVQIFEQGLNLSRS